MQHTCIKTYAQRACVRGFMCETLPASVCVWWAVNWRLVWHIFVSLCLTLCQALWVLCITIVSGAVFSLWADFSVYVFFVFVVSFFSSGWILPCSVICGTLRDRISSCQSNCWSEILCNSYVWHTLSQMVKFLERQLPVSLQEAGDFGIKRGCHSTPHPSGCTGVWKVSSQRTRWAGSVPLHSGHWCSLPRVTSLCLYMCVLDWTGSEADGHVSHPEHPPDSVSSCLRCTGCVTHTFHIPVDVSRRPARQLIVTHAS